MENLDPIVHPASHGEDVVVLRLFPRHQSHIDWSHTEFKQQIDKAEDVDSLSNWSPGKTPIPPRRHQILKFGNPLVQ
ncbi:hypothetical protein K3495_g5990 [Podosphaera aphanis]|nr:hypothetical protein K3495_g5990 [Podosphaera aphanis]